MNGVPSYSLHPVGLVRSTLLRREDAPRQASEGAPEAWIEIDRGFLAALEGIAPETEVVLLTWLHQAHRDVLRVRPRHDPERRLTGVFSTRSPDRPNPVGLHRVRVLEVDPQRGIRVYPLEAIDGTPVIDLKPVLPDSEDACPRVAGPGARG